MTYVFYYILRFLIAVIPFSAITDETILMPTPKYKTPVTVVYKCKKWDPRKRKRVSSQHVVKNGPLLCTKCLVILNPHGCFSVIIHLSSLCVYMIMPVQVCIYMCTYIWGPERELQNLSQGRPPTSRQSFMAWCLVIPPNSLVSIPQWSFCLWLPRKDNTSVSLHLPFFSNQSYRFWELKAGRYTARQAFGRQSYPWGQGGVGWGGATNAMILLHYKYKLLENHTHSF